MPTSLRGIANKAQTNKQHRFGNLYELINEEFLKECWREINKKAAYGVDQISAREYERNLGGNIRDLVERLKRGTYRAKLVRRHYIPKADGKQRGLGIPAIEDKLVQRAVTKILEAIYEQDFLRCSYGYRPRKGALDAVDKLTVKLQFGPYNYIVEADIKAFFDNILHEKLEEMLKERINDGALLRLINKWLKAGVLETDGQVIHPVSGTPQGGIVSPCLANVYLHQTLDLWFQEVVKKHCHGEAFLIRFADDFVCGFEYQEDGEAFYKVLGKRLGKYGLALSASKTRIIEFSRRDQSGKNRLDFLGFEFYWGKDRAGKEHLKRKTSRNKLRKSLAEFTEWCRKKRNQPLGRLMIELKAKLQGYFNYYGVKGNIEGLNEFYQEAMKTLMKWLNRRSQKKSFNWEGFKKRLDHFKIPKPHITERKRIGNGDAVAKC
jgi:RNA-directed DNA polymerase